MLCKAYFTVKLIASLRLCVILWQKCCSRNSTLKCGTSMFAVYSPLLARKFCLCVNGVLLASLYRQKCS